MMSKFGKIIFVATALAPVLITYGMTQFEENFVLFLSLVVVACLLVGICLLILLFSRSELEIHELSLESIKNAEQEVVVFIVAYLIPFMAEGVAELNFAATVTVAVILCVAIFTSNVYHFNPLLGLLGYHFYEITDSRNATFILVTRTRLREISKERRVVEISDYMLLDVGDR